MGRKGKNWKVIGVFSRIPMIVKASRVGARFPGRPWRRLLGDAWLVHFRFQIQCADFDLFPERSSELLRKLAGRSIWQIYKDCDESAATAAG